MAMEKKTVDKISLPPGFRFHPTDEELILHYLRKKVAKITLPPSIVNDINDIELYRYDPWDLPKESTFGDDEWYFFTPRDRKYPNGMRPNRMVASGYWKATGIDKQIVSSSCRSKVIGVKKALVFYTGRPPKGNKTNWIMLEYRLPDHEVPWPIKREKSMRLDDWVLCRIRQKVGMPKEHENQEAVLNHNNNNIKGEAAEMVREKVQRNTNNTMQPFSFPKSDFLQHIHHHDIGKRKHDMELGSYDHNNNKKPDFMINNTDNIGQTAMPSFDVAPSGPALVVYQDIYSLAFADIQGDFPQK